MSYIEIQTTQNISLEYETASIGERFVAILLDWALLFAWVILWMVIIGRLNVGYSVLMIVIIGFPLVFYFLLCELMFNGQSVGKRVMSIRVAKPDGTAPSFGDYFLRWIFRLIDGGITGGSVALLSMICTPKCQRLGDLAAKTCVIRTKKTVQLRKISQIQNDYQVVFDTALQLSDRDVALIAEIIHNPNTAYNVQGLQLLAQKVKEITNTQSNLSNYLYLKTMLADYNYLAGKL